MTAGHYGSPYDHWARYVAIFGELADATNVRQILMIGQRLLINEHMALYEKAKIFPSCLSSPAFATRRRNEQTAAKALAPLTS